jgi:hypothetical protein
MSQFTMILTQFSRYLRVLEGLKYPFCESKTYLSFWSRQHPVMLNKRNLTSLFVQLRLVYRQKIQSSPCVQLSITP